MSSSAPQRQRASELLALRLCRSRGRGGRGAVASDTGQAAEERSRRQQAEAFEQGRQSAQQQLRSELEAALAKHRGEIAQALQEFALERQDYYRRIEGEVVELALAIARKILHREAQIDPQALAGIVRVTLEKLDTGTKVKLHVHPREAADWRHYFACQMEDIPAPEIHEDPGIARENAASKPRSVRPKSVCNRSSRKLKQDCSTCSPKGRGRIERRRSPQQFPRRRIPQKQAEGRKAVEWRSYSPPTSRTSNTPRLCAGAVG